MVVIGIIAILAAILFPVFSSAKASALKSVCAANLGQLGIAVSMYIQDSSGAYPSGTDGITEPFGNVKNIKLTNQLAPYIKSPAVWHCPDDSGFYFSSSAYGGTMGDPAHPTAYATYGTSYLYLLSGQGIIGPPFLDSELVHPARDGLLFDMDGAWHSREPQVPAGAGLTEWSHYQSLYWYNLLYFDGHVKYVSDPVMRTSWVAG